MEILFDGIDTVPVIPVFVNGVARPFVTTRRVRELGEAIGDHVAGLDGERVPVIGSGGLSHDPPAPVGHRRRRGPGDAPLRPPHATPAGNGSSTPRRRSPPARPPSRTSTPTGTAPRGRPSPPATSPPPTRRPRTGRPRTRATPPMRYAPGSPPTARRAPTRRPTPSTARSRSTPRGSG
ncbi:hypothetical protein LH646_16075 [Streptomyces sp. WA1-19]|uniref:DODA-type extradiol aromatic ring-opening family dioxygenase n=1 Tax=Streptomyces sp. WA1-19 TaxID=2884220 RepID=UPI001A3AA017|nr:hypothetical protein [Streptomyces albidoflavus]UDF11639.1 hypothetical protein LH646_16075 [Streptomyces sp. WA1-19]